jgi:L-glyceraldehyde 3-phosphate reductase
MLTNKYLKGIPKDSRAAKDHGFLKENEITEARLKQVQELNNIAQQRGQSLAQMALAWLLKDKRITSVLIGASSSQQLLDSMQCLDNLELSSSDKTSIENILRVK